MCDLREVAETWDGGVLAPDPEGIQDYEDFEDLEEIVLWPNKTDV